MLTIPFCQSLDNGGGSTSSHGGRTSTPNSALDAENMEDKTIDNIKEENGGNGRDALSPSSHGNHFGTSVSPLSSLINQNASSPVNSPLLSLHSSSSANHLSSLAQHHNLNNNKSSNSLLSPANDGRNIEGKRNHMIIDKYSSYVSNTIIILYMALTNNSNIYQAITKMLQLMYQGEAGTETARRALVIVITIHIVQRRQNIPRIGLQPTI